MGLYSLAAVLPYGLICLWLWRAGVWEKFWFWTVEYASKYVQTVPLSLVGAYLWQSGSHIVQSNWPLFLLALVGVAGVAILGRGKPGERCFVYSFLIFSFFLRLSRLLLPRALFYRHAARRGDVGRGWLPVALGLEHWAILVGEGGNGNCRRSSSGLRDAAEAWTFQARQGRAAACVAHRLRSFVGAGGPAVARGGCGDCVDAKRLLLQVEAV